MKHIMTENKRTYINPETVDSQFCVSQLIASSPDANLGDVEVEDIIIEF